MQMRAARWLPLILEADPPIPMRTMHGLAVGDVDLDGRQELIIGGHGGLLWYRPSTGERGVIAQGNDFTVGLAIEDIDGDGWPEVVTSEGRFAAHDWWITWYRPTADLAGPWERGVLDPACYGLAHDIIFADLDGDGRREMVANSVFCPLNGVFIYQPGEDPLQPWQRHMVFGGVHAEGLAAADLTGDGRIEIVNGPDYFVAPAAGPFSGQWQRVVYAPDMRDMGRVLLGDITGNGRPDIVFVESEYVDGRLSWFENRLGQDAACPWVEHPLEDGLVFAHSLDWWTDGLGSRFFLAEMEEGGWNQPYNHTARLLQYRTDDHGATWQRQMLDQGHGTHQAVVVDVDGDGAPEIVGKGGGVYTWANIWKAPAPASTLQFRHRFLDRDKPYTGVDLLAADIDGDGRKDLVTGSWWYRNPSWERYDIPEAYQVIATGDVDGDGKEELIAIKRSAALTESPYDGLTNDGDAWYKGLCSDLCWLKAEDPAKGRWRSYPIGTGGGDWPHGALIAPVLPGAKQALLLCYHGAYGGSGQYPEIFAIPNDPREHPWPRRTLAEVAYWENPVACDLYGTGRLDLVLGGWRLANQDDGTFRPERFAPEDLDIARIAVADVNGNGLLDVVVGEGTVQYDRKHTPFSRLAWLENPGAPGKQWHLHVIDRIRCAHSLTVVDLDGDGELEIVCGEHDPYRSYRTRCRLLVYKKADARGQVWQRRTLDNRFEHHCGARVFEVAPGRLAIASHAWNEPRYVHLWEPA